MAGICSPNILMRVMLMSETDQADVFTRSFFSDQVEVNVFK